MWGTKNLIHVTNNKNCKTIRLDFSVFPLSGQKPTDNDLSPTRPLQHGITYQLFSDTQNLSLLLKLHLKHICFRTDSPPTTSSSLYWPLSTMFDGSYVCVRVWVHVCPHGIFVFFLVTGCISLSSHICMHLFVCALMGVRACVQICVYVYAYLCKVRVWGGGGGGGRGCTCVCIHACYYGCSHLLIYFGFLYVSIDVCGYFYM